MPDGLYERDILVWSEEQANLLRRLEAGERVNGAIDWPNVIEELESVGRSELHACESLLRQALIHLLKLHAWPGSRAASHWRAETLGFLADAQARFSPAMRQRITLSALYAIALRQVGLATDDTGAPQPPPETCPYTLDDLLANAPDIAALVARMPAPPTS